MQRNFRARSLASAALSIVGAFALVAWESQADAQSVCTYDSGSFICDDGNIATPTATGSYSSTYAGVPGYGTLNFIGGESFDVNLQGELSDDKPGYAVYAYSTAGDLTFTSTGSVKSNNGYGIALNGRSITAETGTVNAKGLGVHAYAPAGSINFTGGVTTVTGHNSRAIITIAEGGDNTTNTGTVSATDNASMGVRAGTRALNGSCGMTQVNVTGDISADVVGIHAYGCGDTLVHVQSGRTVTTFDLEYAGTTIAPVATGLARMIIDGAVVNAAGGRAIENKGTSSDITITGQGVLSGRVENSTTGADLLTIQAGGTWLTNGVNTFGVGNDLIVNGGSINISGPTTFTSLETLSNSGTINLQDNVTDDVLTIEGDYAGSGSALMLVDVTGSSADKLIVTGAVSGTTFLTVNAFGEISSTPILVVDANTSSSNAFQLGMVTGDASPFVDFSLVQDGADYFLQAAPSATALQPLAVSRLSQELWYQSADSFSGSSRLGQLGQTKPRKTRMAIWGAGVDVDNRLRIDRRGAQAGVDFLLGDGFLVGLTSGHAEQISNSGGVDAEGHNLGVYGQFGGSKGFYASALFKKDWNNMRLTNGAFRLADGDPDSVSTGVEAEAGYRWQRASMSFGVGGGLGYVRTKIDGFRADGISFDFANADSLRGHLGARADFGGRLAPFIEASVTHKFGSGARLTISTGDELGTAHAKIRETSARLVIGVGGSTRAAPALTGWLEVGDRKGLGLTGGLRF